MGTDDSWISSEMDIDTLPPNTTVSLAGGPSGPTQQSLASLDSFFGRWRDLLTDSGVENAIIKHHRLYPDTDDGDLNMWDTINSSYIHIVNTSNYTVSFKFSWQSNGDEHDVSIEIIDGDCGQCQING